MTMTSREAYYAIVDKLPVKREKVFTVIANGGGNTIREICDYLHWPINTVSPRVFELAEAGLIKPSGITRGGQTEWIPSKPEEVEAMRAARKAAKRYETPMVGFESVGGPEAHGPDQRIRVSFEVPRKVWEKLKTPVMVRFL